MKKLLGNTKRQFATVPLVFALARLRWDVEVYEHFLNWAFTQNDKGAFNLLWMMEKWKHKEELPLDPQHSTRHNLELILEFYKEKHGVNNG